MTLMTSGGRTAGCDGERFDMWTTLVIVHIMCKYQLDLRCPEYGLNWAEPGLSLGCLDGHAKNAFSNSYHVLAVHPTGPVY